MWQQAGVGALRRLRGGFALALWESGTLTLVRDHFGHRPLYYQLASDRTLIASDLPEVVLAWPGTRDTVDVEAVVAECLSYAPVLKTRTTHVAVQRLPAGHLLTWQRGVVRISRYWDPQPTPIPRAAADLAVELRHHVKESVAASVADAERFGAHCSGGLDSSAIAALAHGSLQKAGRDLAGAFSWSPPPLPDGPAETTDERLKVKSVLPAEVPITWTAMSSGDVQATMRTSLRPAAASGLVHEVATAEAARAAGITVLLSGWGGDEFASYHGDGALTGSLARGRLIAATVSCYAYAARAGRSGAGGAVSAARRLLVEGVAPLHPAMNRFLRLRGPAAAIYRDVFTQLHPSAAAMIDEVLRWPKAGAAISQRALLEYGHLEHRLAAWAHLGDDHGIQYRYPLLDVDLVEFCLSVPDSVYLEVPHRRWLFREAMSPFLPAEVCWGAPKAEPAKFRAQLALLAAVPAVSPDGPPEATDVMTRFFELRREWHQRMATM